MQIPWHSSLESLKAHGFGGFQTIGVLRGNNLSSAPGNCGDIGVYIVVRPDGDIPTFLTNSTGGRFKGRDANVAVGILAKKWVNGAKVIYVGKAGSVGKSATLRSRLRQYLAFGAGKPIGHWGGRYLWHLPASDDLIVCWKTTPNEEPRDVERRMIAEFARSCGVRPFANLVG